MAELMEKLNLDAALVSDQKNVYYFSGYVNPSVLTVPACVLFVKGSAPLLLVGNRDRELAEGSFGGEVATYVSYDLGLRMLTTPELFGREAASALRRRSPSTKRLGVESWSISQTMLTAVGGAARGAELVDISPSIMAFRQVKDPDEIQALRESCELDDYAYSVVKSLSVPGMTEVEVYGETYAQVVKRVKAYQYFYGDFVSGERSLEMGGPPTPRVMREGDTFILDLWVTTRGYWADTCRTFVVGGKPSAEQNRVLGIIKEALAAGEEKLRPGVRGKEVYAAMMGVISRAGYGDKFPHHGGHTVGLEAWEAPFVIPGEEGELKEGMVCALEPGIYLAEVGGMRVENNYLIGAHGPERLSKFPVDL